MSLSCDGAFTAGTGMGAPQTIKTTKDARVFNLVPGCEAAPITVSLPEANRMKVVCTISVVA